MDILIDSQFNNAQIFIESFGQEAKKVLPIYPISQHRIYKPSSYKLYKQLKKLIPQLNHSTPKLKHNLKKFKN
jgi:hypothetical protein